MPLIDSALTTNEFTKVVIEHIQNCGGMAWRNNSGKVVALKGKFRMFIQLSPKGSGDVFAIWNGKFYSIEIKRGRDKPNPDQVKWIEDVRARNCFAFVARTLDDVKEYIQ
jgi:hypothetical protein